MEKSIIFKGCATALITPFKNGKIDFTALKNIVDRQLNSNVSALVVAGTTGESSVLTENEKLKLFKFVKNRTKGKIPVIASIGTNNTRLSVKLAREASKTDIDALLAVTPYYNKTTQSGVVRHFEEIANATDLPIIIYTVPSRTGFDIDLQAYSKLCKIKNIVAVKEASGNIKKQGDIINITKGNLQLYSGDDNTALPTYSVGGIGIISVLSNVFPNEVSRVYELYKKGENEKAKSLQLLLCEYSNLIFSEINPLGIKYFLSLSSVCTSFSRPPLYELSSESKKKIKELYNKINGINSL